MPRLSDSSDKPLGQIAAETRRLAAAVRDGSLGLICDHRVLYGAEAAQLITDLRRALALVL